MVVRKQVRDSRVDTVIDGEAVMWLRMGDADRQQYGGPEWVPFDLGALYNSPASQLEGLEREIGFPIFLLLHEFNSYGSRATRAALFIGRRQAGVKRDGRDEQWHEFDPKTIQVRRRDRNPDAAPPDVSGNGSHPGGRGKSRGGSAASPPGSKAAASPPSSTT